MKLMEYMEYVFWGQTPHKKVLYFLFLFHVRLHNIKRTLHKSLIQRKHYTCAEMTLNITAFLLRFGAFLSMALWHVSWRYYIIHAIREVVSHPCQESRI